MNSRSHAFRRGIVGAGCLLCFAATADAQCDPHWLVGSGQPVSGMNGIVWTMTTWDPDDAGPLEPRLIVGGEFTTAGGSTVNRIASWTAADGWSALGSGLNGQVRALAVHNGELYAGGGFTNIGGGGGPALNGIARWDGSSWQPLGLGMIGNVFALTVFSGELVAGGDFTSAGGSPASYVARWNGINWTPVGTGGTAVNNWVRSLTVHSGQLCAAGDFFYITLPGNPRGTASWSGSTWSPMGGRAMNASTHALALSGGTLIAGGQFTQASLTSSNRVAQWNGTAWQPMGTGLNNTVLALVDYNGSPVAGGSFSANGSGTAAANLAAWNGSAWLPLGAGVNGAVRAMTVYDGALVVGGEFLSAGGQPASYWARWGPDAPVIITQHPADVSTCPDADAVLSAAATGPGPIAYEWQWQPFVGGPWLTVSEGPNIDPTGTWDVGPNPAFTATGSATQMLTIRRGPSSDPGLRSGEFVAIASNPCTSDSSNAATVTICSADIDCSGQVSVNDLFAFLAAWFEQNGSAPPAPPAVSADFDLSGTVSVNDLFAFLAAWFAQNGVCG